MSWPWFKNHLGLSLDEQEMKNIPNPTAELMVHVIIKDVQAFGIIGTLIAGPISALRRPETRNLLGLRRRMTRCGLAGVALGCVAGPLMTYARVYTQSEEAVIDRCYRLRNNRGQVRVDQASLVGLIGGGGLSIVLKRCPMFGGLVGMSAGVLGMAYYNNRPGGGAEENVKEDVEDIAKEDTKEKDKTKEDKKEDKKEKAKDKKKEDKKEDKKEKTKDSTKENTKGNKDE